MISVLQNVLTQQILKAQIWQLTLNKVCRLCPLPSPRPLKALPADKAPFIKDYNSYNFGTQISINISYVCTTFVHCMRHRHVSESNETKIYKKKITMAAYPRLTRHVILISVTALTTRDEIRCYVTRFSFHFLAYESNIVKRVSFFQIGKNHWTRDTNTVTDTSHNYSSLLFYRHVIMRLKINAKKILCVLRRY